VIKVGIMPSSVSISAATSFMAGASSNFRDTIEPVHMNVCKRVKTKELSWL
jgi:hypothetical protein